MEAEGAAVVGSEGELCREASFLGPLPIGDDRTEGLSQIRWRPTQFFRCLCTTHRSAYDVGIQDNGR